MSLSSLPLINDIKNGYIMLLYEDNNKLNNTMIDYINEGLKNGCLCIYASVYIGNSTGISLIDNLSSKVENYEEKALALNALMEKYQKEGKYQRLDSKMRSVQEVTVIKIIPMQIRGKYKIGQQWTSSYRLKIGASILAREKEAAMPILDIMGIEILPNSTLRIQRDPIL